MATRTVKSDSGNDLKLQNNGGTGSVTITDAGDLTIDSPADIILDADGADVTLKDGGTTYGTLKQVSGDLVIQPAGGGQIVLNEDGGAAALTIDADGDVTIEDGDVTIEDGDLIIGTSSGHGIDFSATSDAGGKTSELLDDYEEGTWSPVYDSASGSFDTMTMEILHATYTKIGRKVTLTGYIRTDEVVVGTASGYLQVGGLPFPPSGWSAVTIGYAYNFAASKYPSSGYIDGNDYFVLDKRDAVDGATSACTPSNLHTGVAANYNRIMFAVTYFV